LPFGTAVITAFAPSEYKYIPGLGIVVPPGPALTSHSKILGVGWGVRVGVGTGLGEGVGEELGRGVGVGVMVGHGEGTGVGVGLTVG
jgi:hypothetical protein